ncbi:MAG TPA: hypothetical protein VIN08_26050 [Ohtaekwangia sp.]|uniref:hypothetical protein n=1 Tax=Ohtaekwangia sp. TaxID=2066019 RepID=UPI002F954523
MIYTKHESYNIYDDHYLWVTDQLPVKTIPKVKIVYHVNDETKVVKLLSIAEHIDQP